MDKLISRRTLLRVMGAMGAGLAVPGFAFAQAVKTVAVLFAGDSDDDEPSARPFFNGMAKLGWVEGRTVAYDRHSGKGTRQYLAAMASVAAGRSPDLIYATTTSLAAALLKETDSLPVVFATAGDPVAGGLVVSLARPGKNATGTYQAGDATAKRYSLVRQALPQPVLHESPEGLLGEPAPNQEQQNHERQGGEPQEEASDARSLHDGSRPFKGPFPLLPSRIPVSRVARSRPCVSHPTAPCCPPADGQFYKVTASVP